MNPPATAEYQEAAALVSGWNRPLLVSHMRSDGDALGSLAAVRLALRSLGVEGTTVVFDALPARYEFMRSYGQYKLWPQDVRQADLDQADGIVLLDTCSSLQVEPLADWIRAASVPKVVVDHHVTRDIPMDCCLIDESAAATCSILFEWFEAAGWSMDRACATALFVGVATDTGWFRHSNTDGRTMATVGALIDHGCQPHELYELLYQRESPARYRLRAAAANRLELLADGQVAIVALPEQVFTECGASRSDTEDLVSEPLRIRSVILSAMLVEHGAEMVRVGFRSKAPAEGTIPDVDVAALAAGFDGGGHRRAAGARISASLSDAKRQVAECLERALTAAGWESR